MTIRNDCGARGLPDAAVASLGSGPDSTQYRTPLRHAQISPHPVEQLLESWRAALVADMRRVFAEEIDRRLAAPAEQLTTEQFAKLHQLQPATIRAYIASGRLQATRVGRHWRLRADQQLGVPAVADAPAAHAARIVGRRAVRP